jgi:hypothetical protein
MGQRGQQHEPPEQAEYDIIYRGVPVGNHAHKSSRFCCLQLYPAAGLRRLFFIPDFNNHEMEDKLMLCIRRDKLQE